MDTFKPGDRVRGVGELEQDYGLGTVLARSEKGYVPTHFLLVRWDTKKFKAVIPDMAQSEGLHTADELELAGP